MGGWNELSDEKTEGQIDGHTNVWVDGQNDPESLTVRVL